MKVVILCGGKGTRFREYPEEIPKPLAVIGGKPILWHLMKTYSHYGYKDFILCLGYKGDMIKKYFIEEEWRASDFTMNLKNRQKQTLAAGEEEDWNITFADTGLETNTGGRIKRIEKYIPQGEDFFATYGDGLANIDIRQLLEFHKKKGGIATITCLRPYSQFGIVEIDDNSSAVTSFKEKPRLDYWINGGFFVFKKEIFNYLGDNDVLEQKPFETLAAKKEIAAYKFEGFWQCMDTFKDYQSFNELWEKGAPWKVWR
ncbi:glucose-1-phosphate cytidylyltransferase [Candidatus Woesearchaeota archaeon]|nr:glucose-1-phosphate cytidylyltransferase [Candidatus Woesearchaeota archaeon]